MTTRELANNIAQASNGIQEMNQSMTQSPTVAEDIARDISEVTQSAGDISNSSTQLSTG